MFNALIALINRDEEGQGLAEYALILALIAIVAIVALIFLGSQVSTILSKVGGSDLVTDRATTPASVAVAGVALFTAGTWGRLPTGSMASSDPVRDPDDGRSRYRRSSLRPGPSRIEGR